MSTLLSSLGRWSYRHPWRVLFSWLIVLAIAGGGALFLQKGTDNTFSIPGTESQAGLEQLSRSFPQVSGTNAQFIVVAGNGDRITDSDYREPIDDAIDELEDLDGVLAVTSPFDEMVEGMVTDDSAAALVQLQFDGQVTDVSDETKDDLTGVVDDLRDALPSDAQTALGGDLFSTSIPGVTATEAIGVIVALIVLIIAFRSLLVAWFPLVTALLGVGISMAGIYAATAFTTISSVTPLLALMLGLAVGIDYSLFIVARHQDQVRSGTGPEESTSRAVGTAGSAVVFAGITVLIALIGLGFAGIPFLTTMGIAASVAVAIAVLIAVTLTPAFLGFTKGRVVGWRRKERKKKATRERRGFASRWVGGVTKHPVLASLAVLVGLGVVAVPALSLNLALPNAGQLPQDSEARQSYDLVGEHFGPGFNGPLVLTGTIVTSTDPLGLMEDLGDAVADVPGVKEVALATPNETADTGIVQIVPETAPDDPATADVVRELRSHHDEWLDEFGIDLKVTGFTAVAIDISDQLGAALLPFGIFVIGLSLVLLTIVFRSLWVPITAALGYLLSIVAAFGIVGAVFEWGWFADFLHVAKVGPIISFMPIVLMGVLFGLAMDYQVFLVSRMREEYVHDAGSKSRDRSERRAAAIRAVRSGFTGSSKVVTAAGLIMFAVFVAFVPEGDSSLKPIALGLASGIAIDAFLVRMTLIPALMTILGDRAWRIPAWLERVLPSVDIEGEAVERERHLAEWPGDDSVVAADDVMIDGRALNLRLGTGESVVLSDAPARTLREVALTVAGRMSNDTGRLRTAGHLLPGRATWVRRHVGLAFAAEDDGAELSEALRGQPPLLVIDGVDLLSPAARDRVAAQLRDAAPTLAILATALDADAAREVLAEAGREASVLSLRPSAETPTSRRNPQESTDNSGGLGTNRGSRRDAEDSTAESEVTA